MLRKVSGLLRRGHGQDAAAPRSRLHTEDTDHDASGKGLQEARLPSRIFPDGPLQVSEEDTFGEDPGRAARGNAMAAASGDGLPGNITGCASPRPLTFCP